MVFGQLAVFAEFEREQIRERTKAGMEAARARGKHIGRPRTLTARQIKEARRYLAEGHKPQDAAARFKVSAATIRRAIR